MSDEQNAKIIINNYFFMPYEVLKKINPKQVFYPLASIHENNLNQKIYLNKKRKITNIEIVKQEEENECEEKDIEKKNDEDNIPIKINKNITIEINDKKKNKFVTKKTYFTIKNIKKIGRKPKSSVIKGYHTKFSNDNILRKIKVKFFNKLVKYINNLILIKYKNKLKFIKPLKSNIAQNNKKRFNIDLLSKKIKDIFSTYKINGKFKLLDGDNPNKIVIKNIYDDNIIELIDIFEMTLLEVFIIFRDSNEEQKLIGLEKLDKIIEELKIKESEEYINKFKTVAMNFEHFYFINNKE